MKVSHASELVSNLKGILNDPTLSDIQILVGKEQKVFYANSFVLASRSPIFKAMFFTSGLREQQTKQLELKESNPITFLSFLEYLTTGEVELTGQVK